MKMTTEETLLIERECERLVVESRTLQGWRIRARQARFVLHT